MKNSTSEEAINQKHVEEISQYIKSHKDIQLLIERHVKKEFFGQKEYAA